MFQDGQGYLKDHECVCTVIPPPDHPEAVAENEAPEANLAPAFGLGRR